MTHQYKVLRAKVKATRNLDELSDFCNVAGESTLGRWENFKLIMLAFKQLFVVY